MLRCLPRFRSLVLLPLCAAGFMAGAQQGGDLQAQIEYAFHAEDTNQLASLIQNLNTQMQAGGADSALRYHLAHAEYRSGLLAEKRARSAEPAFAECIDQLKAVLERDERDVNSVEALALQSACYSNLAGFRKMEAALLRSRAADRLGAAFKLAPTNPRVVFLMAVDALARGKPGSVENGQGFTLLQRAAQLFEQSSATRIDAPGWGHAEAYLELGRQLEARGDVLGARNWIEQSLIAAPDYKAAQRQLGGMVRR
jgi:tetratricopeptide (TPR) repeat protein